MLEDLRHFQTPPKPEIVVRSFDPETGACNLEGKDGRAKTCPNNPNRNPGLYIEKLCIACPTDPKIAASPKNGLPDVYLPLRKKVK